VESPAAPAQPGRSRDPLDKAIHDVLTPAPPLDEARAFICWRAGLSEPSSSMRERNGGMRSAAAPEYLELWSARSLPCHGRCLRSILFAVEGSAAHLCVPSLTDTDVSLPPRSVRHDGSGLRRLKTVDYLGLKDTLFAVQCTCQCSKRNPEEGQQRGGRF